MNSTGGISLRGPAILRLATTAIMLLMGGFLVSQAHATAGAVSGELKQWHKITIDFTGPQTSETASPNPFTDYRLNVTFTHPATGKSFLVPGYYAADGDAANTSAVSGAIWRVHFAPEEIGEWTFFASFREGADVATDEDPEAGQSAGHFDGEAGSFIVQPSDKTGRDFRARGRLEYVGKHHLRFAGSGGFFMKAGTDSPENLLAYQDFDGDFKTDGEEDDYIKDWAPHIQDWQEGDPVWQGDKGKGLIGAVNYLASEGLNAFSFLTMNIEGDDRNVFPYLDYDERERMDVSRLDQWEIVFEHATRQGLYLHFKTQERENHHLLDGGDLGNERKLYYRELIARFSHHLALNWNLGEENNSSTERKEAWARYFHENDPYRNHIVIHNGANHFDLMGPGSEVTGMSLQMSLADYSDTFVNVLRYVDRSADEGKPWVVACDEPGSSSVGLRPDDDPGNRDIDGRRNALWGAIMAGGAGIEFYFGYHYDHSDLTCNDFRSRDGFWPYCRTALEFFEGNHFAFALMKNHNELVSGAGDNANRCLAKVGDTYLVHLPEGGSHSLDLSSAIGTFNVSWFNPRTGGPLVEAAPLEAGGWVELGSPPDSTGEDWVVLVKAEDGASGTNSPPVVHAGPDRSAFLTDASVNVTLSGSVTDDGLPDEFALTREWSRVAGPAEVSFSNPASSITTATFTQAGEYTLRLFATDSDLSNSDEVTVIIQLPDVGGELAFPPLHDAYLDEGANDNGPTLEITEDLRTAYLQFDLSAVDSPFEAAVLSLTESGAAAGETVTLRLFAADSNDWTEAAIDGDNAPAAGEEIAVFTGEVTAGQVIDFDLSAHVTGPGVHSFVLEAATGSSGIVFASKEHATEDARPSLTLATVPNSPPDFDGYLLATPVNKTATLPYSLILDVASDPDEDPLTLAIEDGSTASGGYITAGVDSLTYAPPIDYLGEDSFTLTVEDGRGGSVQAPLELTVVEADGIEGATPSLEDLPDGGVRLEFAGLPGFLYAIERSTNLVEWIPLKTLSGGQSGGIEFIDPTPPPGAAFYRVAAP